MKNIDKREQDLQMLSDFVGPINAFGKNNVDEVLLNLDKNSTVGVFKTWAFPIIPFMEIDRVDIFNDVWKSISKYTFQGKSFEEALDVVEQKEKPMEKKVNQVRKILSEWTIFSLKYPNKFKETLEKYLYEGLLRDKYLIDIYDRTSLPNNPKERLQVLITRFEVTLGILSPIYNIEALVDDLVGFKWNPIHLSEKENKSDIKAGILDAFAFLLPSIFKDDIYSTEALWRKSTREDLEKKTKKILARQPEGQILLDVSDILSTYPEYILYGLNILQWSPIRFGGKMADQTKEKALEKLIKIREDSLGERKENLIKVGKNLNAQLRFLNWLPIDEYSNKRLAPHLTYASVVETSEKLFQLAISDKTFWKKSIFSQLKKYIFPQMEKFPIPSVKGRAIYSLLLDNKNTNIDLKFHDQKEKEKIISTLDSKIREKFILPIKGIQPKTVVGEKTLSLQKLMAYFEDANISIPDGIVITSTFIDTLVQSNRKLWTLILKLNKETSLTKKIGLGKEIQIHLARLTIPSDLKTQIINDCNNLGPLLAVRISSVTEDEYLAAGVYRTYLEVPVDKLIETIIQCVQSFYSEIAIRFRHVGEHADISPFAIIVQTFIKGYGGVASIIQKNGQTKLIIEVGTTASTVTSGESSFTRFETDNQGKLQKTFGDIPTNLVIMESLKNYIDLIYRVKNQDVTVEWIQDSQDKLWIVQYKTSQPQQKKYSKEKIEFVIKLDSYEKLGHLEKVLTIKRNKGAVILSKNIDIRIFQAELFRIITGYADKILEIWTYTDIPSCSHFANCCNALGITIRKLNSEEAPIEIQNLKNIDRT